MKERLHTLLGDHLNTVRDVIATNGTVENHLVYDAYGVLKSQTPGGYSPFVKFTGKFFDTATGLQYNHHRWYDATVGRWISEDPIGFAGGDANLVRYVGNSPVGRSDPRGLLPIGKEAQAAWKARRVAQLEAIYADSINGATNDSLAGVLGLYRRQLQLAAYAGERDWRRSGWR